MAIYMREVIPILKKYGQVITLNQWDKLNIGQVPIAVLRCRCTMTNQHFLRIAGIDQFEYNSIRNAIINDRVSFSIIYAVDEALANPYAYRRLFSKFTLS